MELYKTVRKQAEATQIIEKSRFIAHVKPVETREEAEAFIAEIRKKHKDATHNVPAMVLGDKSQIQWASDDGEPQGTSGAPMVQMMVKEGLANLVVVVTRYFGGIKLGTGGLVRAYTSSAKLGIEAAGVCSVQEVCRMTVRTDYTYLAKLQKAAAEALGGDAESGAAYAIDGIQYTDKVSMELLAYPEHEAAVNRMLANMTAGTAEVVNRMLVMEKV